MKNEPNQNNEAEKCSCPFCDSTECPIPAMGSACRSSGRVKLHRLDCVGLYCPVPIMRAKEEMDQLADGALLEIVADDPATDEDIPRWAKRAGHQLLHSWKENDETHFVVQKGCKEDANDG